MAVNPVLTGERRNQYTSSGSLGPYNFTFVIYADADLSVYVDDTLKTLSTHYTVSTNANGTGSITFTAGNAPASGALVTIIGNKDISRSTRFTSGGPLTADALETEFNAQTALLQQLDEKISRAITLPIETDATRPIEFPYDNTEANNADRVVKFNAAGSALEIGPTAANLETLAAIAADISTVAGISADITSVAADAADIGVVSTNIASVNTVANNINDVITVANDLNEAVSEVETVADDLNEAVSEIDTVANNITEVQTVGNATNIANIGTVAGEISPTNNISTVASANANISTVATDLSGSNTIGTVATDLSGVNNIGTVVTNISNVNTVGTNLSGSNTIGTVATNINDVNTVAADTADIQTLADIEDGTVATNAVSNAGNNSTNITTVAGQISPTNNISTVAVAAPNIATVAGQISPTNNISTVAGANTNISTIASNLTGANTIGTVAADLSGSNTIGTVATNITDVQDVAANISDVNSFAERYRVASSDPTTSLDAGDLAFNTTGSVLKYYDGSAWQGITAGGITDVVQDSTPQLGGNLDLNSNDVTGTGNVNITGNISLTGTVDGRDIATDGTKLDGIESGATADQTDAQIKTAYENNANTNAFTDAEKTKLSGVATSATANPNAIDNVVEDTTPQLGGNLDLNSNDITGTGDVNITGTVTATSFSGDGSALTGILTGTNWQSTIVTGTTLSATVGSGYWIDTSSNACTVTLPGSASVGDTIELVDYARTWATNNVTINQNSLNFQGFSSPNPVYDTNGQSVRLVYSGATKGWIPTTDDDVTDEVPQNYNMEYLVVAGGGAGGGTSPYGSTDGGGGGAGGMRTGSYTNVSVSSGIVFTATVGGGVTGTLADRVSGNNSSLTPSATFSTVSCTGGGGGGATNTPGGANGGSGGGATNANTNGGGGSGTSGEGNSGGNAGTSGAYGGGAGGGKSTAGGAGSGTNGGTGGNGLASSITGSSITYAGGGGGGCFGGTAGSGGTGGGGAGSDGNFDGIAGGTNLGGGGGGGSTQDGYKGGNGGSGVIILRVPTFGYSGTTTGSPTVTDDGDYKVIKFTGSGSYTA